MVVVISTAPYALMTGWKKRSKSYLYPSSCPNRCNANINPMSSGALKKIYNALEIKCLTCPKIVALLELKKH